MILLSKTSLCPSLVIPIAMKCMAFLTVLFSSAKSIILASIQRNNQWYPEDVSEKDSADPPIP